jgi:hypothetical protein
MEGRFLDNVGCFLFLDAVLDSSLGGRRHGVWTSESDFFVFVCVLEEL